MGKGKPGQERRHLVPGQGTPLHDGEGDDDLDACLLYTSDAADERSSVDLGGRRIIKKKTNSRRG